MKDESSASGYCYSCLNHDLVDYLRVCLHLELSFLIDANESGEESFPRDSEMVKLQISIVYAVVAKFGTDVTHLDSRERFMCLKVTYRYDVWLHTIVSLISDASGKDDGVCGLDSQIARPELGSSDRWSMNHELISLHIQSGRSLQPRNIRPMT